MLPITDDYRTGVDSRLLGWLTVRVFTSWGRGSLKLKIRLDDGEVLSGIGQDGMAIRLVTDEASVRHPALSAATPPDLVALAILSVVAPWVGHRLWIDNPVSPSFSDAVEAAFSIELGPVDGSLAPRSPGKRAGLLYSGGVDSRAFVELLPPDSPLVFLKRVRHRRVPNRATHLRVDVSEHFARKVETPQRRLQVVATDLEFLCQPFPTFPTWPAISIGAVLLADHLELGAVASGMILGARYLSNGLVFNPDGDNDWAWRLVFEAAGLPMFRGLAGASEIATYEFVDRIGRSDIVRSCGLGSIESPCWQCRTCLRKALIGAALRDEPLPSALLEMVATNEKVVGPLLGPPPYYQQHVLEYALARVPGIDGTFLENARDRLAPTAAGTSWVRRYYSPALEDVPATWRDTFQSQLLESMEPMSETDRATVEHWDAAHR